MACTPAAALAWRLLVLSRLAAIRYLTSIVFGDTILDWYRICAYRSRSRAIVRRYTNTKFIHPNSLPS